MPGEIGKGGSRKATGFRAMRRYRLLSSARGVTLIEVMIALVVLLIVFTGLIQAALLSINFNVRNQVRDEAVRIASDAMANLRTQGFNQGAMTPTGSTLEALPSTVSPGPTPQVSIGNYVQQYKVDYQVQFIDSPKINDEEVTVQVSYNYRTDPKVTYSLNSIVVNPGVLNQ